MLSEKIRFCYLTAGFFSMLMLFQDCIKDGLENCGDEEEALLYVTVVDLLSGLDITDGDEVDDVDLFIFDSAEKFIEHITVPKEKQVAREPIPIKYSDRTQELWVSAWGNLKDGQTVPILTDDCMLCVETITLITGDDGYTLCPDDLFFGVKQINLGQTSREVTIIREELPISRKNARMHLTVIGLPDDSDETDYYFTIQGGYNGYNFKGEPVTGEHENKQVGIFNDKREYSTADAFNIIHSLENDKHITVNLYKEAVTTRSPVLLASVTEDNNGVRIAPLAGETTNVLIDLRGAAMTVRVEQTPWNQIYNWVSW